MATFTADKVATTIMSRAGIDVTCVTGTYTVAANLGASDIIQMVKVPKGATVVEVVASTSASIAATSTCEFGDGGDTDRFIASGGFGSGAAALSRLNAATGHGYTYTDEDTIDFKTTVQTTPTTGAVIKLTAIYQMQQ